MSMQIQNRITAKLFIGFLLTSEVKMHLNQSPTWKKSQVGRSDESSELIEVRYEDHDYIGRYLKESKILLNDLKQYEQITTQQLQSYCPKLPMTSFKFSVFPQVFIQ